jgi:putative hydrolase of the HAD superfamily
MRWQAVVFDLDDTLFPERSYVLSGFRAVAEHAAASHGADAVKGYAELVRLFESGVRAHTFDLWTETIGLPRTSVADFVRVYRDHVPQLQPFPEAEGLLRELKGRVKIGLVSDGWSAVQRGKLEALGLASYFDAVVFSDDLGGRAFWKPSTAPFEAVLAQLGVPPPQAVYVADNCAKDFFGARSLGMSTIHILRSGAEYAHVRPSGPDWAADETVDSLAGAGKLMGIA